jgi:hypothetical protein
MSETQEKKAAQKKRVLVDVEVVADLSNMCWYRQSNVPPEEWAKHLEYAVKEFEDFLRDHRSQDKISLDVRRVYQKQCSACEGEWEPERAENGVLFCANCGVEIVEELEHDEEIDDEPMGNES